MSLKRYLATLGASLGIVNILLVIAGYSGIRGYFVINALVFFALSLVLPLKSAKSVALSNTLIALVFIGFLTVVAITTGEAIRAM